MEWDRAKESVSKKPNQPTKHQNNTTHQKREQENRPQQENVSSSVWREMKNGVKKKKSHDLEKTLNRGRLV